MQHVIYPSSSTSESKMGILKKSVRVMQGYTIVARLLEICENTENRLKLIEMGNSFHMKITVRKNQRNFSNFMQNSAKKLWKNTIIYIKQQRSKSHIFGFCLCNIVPPPWYKTTLPHNVYYVDTRLWYKRRLVSRGGTMFHKIIPFLVDYIVKNGHIYKKISKIIPNSEIFLPHTDDPLSGN